MTIHNRSAEPVGGRRRPLRLIVPIPPRASPRACLEAQIDLLLEMLDQIDGDPDLEDNGDLEPSLGSYCGAEPDLELDPSDSEPSLGSFDRMLDQTHWHGSDSQFVNGIDLELDRADHEPWLSPIRIADHRLWAEGDRQDLEEEHDREMEADV